MKNISIINACSDLGLSTDGTNLGPEILTKDINSSNVSSVQTIKKGNFEKDRAKDNKRKNLEGVNEFNSRLYNLEFEILENNEFPLTIGGDHSVAISSALASINHYKNLGIIWLDAHGDFNTFNSTESGNIHGLPLAVVTNYEKESLSNFHNGNFYNFKNTVIVGGRDIDRLEKENLKDAGVTVFSSEDIKKYGAKEILEKAFSIAKNGTDGVHISFDVDLIDPNIAPGVSVPADNGINLEEVYSLIDTVIEHKDIIKSMDIVEYNPLKDENDVTKNITKTIINKVIENF